MWSDLMRDVDTKSQIAGRKSFPSITCREILETRNTTPQTSWGNIMTITARTILATVEAIPETAENFPTRREAIRDLRILVERETAK